MMGAILFLVAVLAGMIGTAWGSYRVVRLVTSSARDLSPEAEDELRRLLGREERRVSRDERIRQAVETGRVP